MRYYFLAVHWRALNQSSISDENRNSGPPHDHIMTPTAKRLKCLTEMYLSLRDSLFLRTCLWALQFIPMKTSNGALIPRPNHSISFDLFGLTFDVIRGVRRTSVIVVFTFKRYKIFPRSKEDEKLNTGAPRRVT